eukprot:CAMPEP_0197519776 /NCGR_PEP_ID=MMETSP1318-20131121/5056_1 /TAXON_ID=552666 /ORGANISM="Partenskyella glossopodia, Strain RCC365" /LENGTH=240 /DNA_ID=CAMNT_0043070949 /DNA_START=429 /DNA_END=1151 /DNA_ORIENTATION=-
MTTPGVYLEIGSYHPMELSQTAFFDLCLGWSGICVEPDPPKFKEWDASIAKGERSCNLYKHCLLDKNATVCMSRSGVGEGGTSVNMNGKCDGAPEATCVTLEHMVETQQAKSRVNKAVSVRAQDKQTIHFASLDVEGKEIEVMRCFPFHKYDIWMWILETNRAEVKLDWFMMNKGYLKYDNLRNWKYPTDTLYVKRELLHPGWKDVENRVKMGTGGEQLRRIQEERFFDKRESNELKCPY